MAVLFHNSYAQDVSKPHGLKINDLSKFHDDQMCLPVFKIHSPIHVAGNIVHKLNQLGFAIPLMVILETMPAVSKIAFYVINGKLFVDVAYVFMLQGLQQMYMSDTGL